MPHVHLRERARAPDAHGSAADGGSAGGGGSSGAGEGGGGSGGGAGGEGEGVVSSSSSSSSSNAGLMLQLVMARAQGTVVEESEGERRRKQEEDLLRQVKQMQKPSLMSGQEAHEGRRAVGSVEATGWRPPSWALQLGARGAWGIRQELGIEVEGESIPAPLRAFADMKLPPAVLRALESEGIRSPTPIQVQGLPVALSGRDMVGVASTGSGKTLCFSLPIVCFALQEELRKPLQAAEGPFGLLLAPLRDLARQTAAVVDSLTQRVAAESHGRLPRLRVLCSVGGGAMGEELDALRRGVHIVVATPGRLLDHIQRGRVRVDLVKYVVLDEGDRMLEDSFAEDVRNIFSKFSRPRQTLIFSATMPKRFEEFAAETLSNPVVVNVGRSGAASRNVEQHVHLVDDARRFLLLLEALRRTPPPAIVFASNIEDVDRVHEYLLIKGISATCVHGRLDQAERNEAIDAFRAGRKDVLVATDVAGKGLDFKGIEHVINYDMPEDIENYVHRIGRTGRSGRKGVATTFITHKNSTFTVLDLKHLLKEAHQPVPAFMAAIDDPLDREERDEAGQLVVCKYCEGLGHSIIHCPKLARHTRRLAARSKDGIRGGE